MASLRNDLTVGGDLPPLRTIYRLRPSGSPGDPDIFGSQRYAPLLDIDVPAE